MNRWKTKNTPVLSSKKLKLTKKDDGFKINRQSRQELASPAEILENLSPKKFCEKAWPVAVFPIDI